MRFLMALMAGSLVFGADTRPVTITGLVVDTGCYLSHDTKGEKHVKCATACANAGVPLAILDEATSAVYLPVAMDHKNQNAKLMPFIEKKVKVTGALVEKGGIKGIILKTIEAAN
ncbi:MAG: hypothetical protein HY235_11115 [Acidobacteria bacterium]|nr:hypothetical protein [Acidobacteriota bacterium]